MFVQVYFLSHFFMKSFLDFYCSAGINQRLDEDPVPEQKQEVTPTLPVS